ncbi:MAG: VWA domain-containing protein [Lewinella sp.]|nr:VWA domain-containing protein [Lewinella sp.]
MQLPNDISQQLREEYARFVEFGNLLDRTTRKYLVQYLQHQLSPAEAAVPEIRDEYFQYFRAALDDIFAVRQLLDLCRRYPRITRQVVLDTLYWLRKTYDKLQRKNPYQEETDLLENYGVTPLHVFHDRWHLLLTRLQRLYTREEIDLRFYENRFRELTQGKQFAALDEPARQRFELLFHDLLAQWDARLQAKLLAYQLTKLAEERNQYVQLLEAKVSEYQRLTKLVSPFTEYFGWDLSRELWQDASFDLLQQYHDLLADEQSLQELADLLGRLREAEIELEEETLNETIIRQEWREDPHTPAEITGVHESADLSRLLSSEASLLADEDTETLFLKRFVEKNLQTFRYQDQQLVSSEDHEMTVYQRIKQREKGPFIVCVDTSESMTGDPERIAKVLTLGVLKMAMRENRRAYLINFSIGIKTLDLYDIANSLDEVANFLRMSFHGGTDISLPLFEAIRQLRTHAYQDADVLVVSDFIMYRVNADVLAEVRHFQQNQGTQFHCLTIGQRGNPEIMRHFDTSWLYDPAKKGVIRELSEGLRVIGGRF